MSKAKDLLNEISAHQADHSTQYFYRVHPRGDIRSVLRGGLYTASPSDGPGSYVDAPELERWPDQDPNDPQTYRLYVANSEWECPADRFPIRIPAHFIEPESDHLGDYYIDSGYDVDHVLDPNQFDIKIGDKWVRADMVDPVMLKSWEKAHSKPAGFYGNKFYDEEKEEDAEDE